MLRETGNRANTVQSCCVELACGNVGRGYRSDAGRKETIAFRPERTRDYVHKGVVQAEATEVRADAVVHSE